jgi:hypothetical protein
VAAESIVEIIDSLTAQEQDAVREFIRFLKSNGPAPRSPFLTAVDEFIDQHPELLRRLAR